MVLFSGSELHQADAEKQPGRAAESGLGAHSHLFDAVALGNRGELLHVFRSVEISAM